MLWGLAWADTGFADSLYAHQEFYRAITEYQRAFYAGAQKEYCHAMIRECYLAGEDLEGLIDYLKGSSDPVDHLYSTLAHLKNNRPDLAAIINDDPSESAQIVCYGFSKSYLGEFDAAEQRLTSLSQPEYQALKDRLLSLNRETQAQHHLSPTLAGVLGIVPGLGYAYGGAWQTALSALVTNALIGAAVYELGKKELYITSGAVAVAGMGFYLGSIYGSANHAARKNRDTRKRYLDSYSDEIFKELLEITATQ